MVLIAAMAVSFGTQDFISGGVIAALVVLNVGVGTINEYNAEKVSPAESLGYLSYLLLTCSVIRLLTDGSSPRGSGKSYSDSYSKRKQPKSHRW